MPMGSARMREGRARPSRIVHGSRSKIDRRGAGDPAHACGWLASTVLTAPKSGATGAEPRCTPDRDHQWAIATLRIPALASSTATRTSRIPSWYEAFTSSVDDPAGN